MMNCDLNTSPSPELVERIAARRRMISTKGKTARGVSYNVDPETPPPWFEKSSFEHAQKLFKTYRVIISISQLIGLNLVLNFTHGLVPLLVTGNSKTISKLFVRYLSTTIHVTNWFEHDPFDKKSKAYRSLRMVRGMHQNVSNRMNTEAGLQEDGETVLWIPQYGMCHAQFSFVGMMTVFPKQFGFHNFSEKDFHAMFHFWRVIGYCLGTDDLYNLCSGSDEETFELCRQIYFHEWLPVIRSASEKTGVEMSKGINIAMARINPNLSYNALMRHCSLFLELNPFDYQLQSRRERCLYRIYGFLFNRACKSQMINRLMARAADIRLKRAIANRKFHEQNLKECYPNITYENDRCPFDVNFNYTTAIEAYHGNK
ncbi:uncharacterized protein LOC124492181 [Dermatophagoides farinae]|uniref:ER-bound oxygenase mpaB/mpaB'/Rubber oxygenase catalytic domain-containing protein n=1 Tax=Dermatophagoides farinae TaxID=6954 RepID=A0A922LD20_DERFA|nr:hypothetical protein HUG17_4730 [Dermatophagoides farinae]KAH9527635.1 hypothetical protein DERF_001643 [Dermatophagoides farinae]